MRRTMMGLAVMVALGLLVGRASADTHAGVGAYLAAQSVASHGHGYHAAYRYHAPHWRHEPRYYPAPAPVYVSRPYRPYYPAYPAYYPPSAGFYYAQPNYSFWIGF